MRTCLLLAALLLSSCATGVVDRSPGPPALTPLQLMGFDPPPGMLKDESSGQWANRDVMEAFGRLREKGRKDGYEIVIVSGRRSFAEQKVIWNRKWRSFAEGDPPGDEALVWRILQYTSVPGYSRHHWGTELDLSEERARREMRDPLGSKSDRADRFYEWLRDNAPDHGFCQPFRGKGAVKAEPWHWTYYRYSSVYEAQMDGLVNSSRIAGRGIRGEPYIAENLWRIYRDQRRSVHRECRVPRPLGTGPRDGGAGPDR